MTCTCGPGIVQKYLARISGPLLDLIDIQIEVVPVPFKELTELSRSESSESIRKRVVNARLIQEQQFLNLKGIYCNDKLEWGG